MVKVVMGNFPTLAFPRGIIIGTADGKKTGSVSFLLRVATPSNKGKSVSVFSHLVYTRQMEAGRKGPRLSA